MNNNSSDNNNTPLRIMNIISKVLLVAIIAFLFLPFPISNTTAADASASSTETEESSITETESTTPYDFVKVTDTGEDEYGCKNVEIVYMRDTKIMYAVSKSSDDGSVVMLIDKDGKPLIYKGKDAQ